MRKTTKVISLLLTLAMVFTMALPMAVSAAYSDVPSNHQYYKAITNLSAEGILAGMGDGTFKPGDPVTRAQFTKVICYALSVGNLTYSTEEKSIFTDLSPDHWAADNIVTAYNQKIINGMGDGTFAPEAGVQYEQAVKMVVCALGYGDRALSLGEYPTGYMNMANQLKLLKGITDAKMYEVMNRGAVAQLIDNMMNAGQLQDGQVGGSIRDEVSTSKNVDGQIVAGHDVALFADATLEACKKNEILLASGGEYTAFDISELKNFDIYEYLGRSVTIYYEEETGIEAQYVKSIAMQNRRNETIKIELDKIYDFDGSSIEYYVDEDRIDTEIVTYQTSSHNLWNGQPDSRSVEQLLNLNNNYLKSGHITLVSSMANQSADVVFLKTYDTFVVSTVDTKNNKVFSKNASYAGGIVLDVTDSSKNVTIKQNGSDYALSSIRSNHILSISQDASGKVIEVLVSTKAVSGTIESASGLITSVTPNVPEKFKLNTGNTQYSVSPDVYAESGSVLEVGKYVTISLDAFGKVARYVVTGETSYNYGYIASLEEQGTSSNPELWIMLYKPKASNSNLTGQIVKFADRININGTNYSIEDKKDNILSILLASANTFNAGTTVEDSGDVYAQPIRYSLNNSNQVNAIITGTAASGPVSDNTTKLNLINNVSGINCTVDATTFADKYRVSSSTPVLVIPSNRAAGTYSTKTNKLFKAGTSYNVQFANTSSAGVVGCVFVYDDGMSLNAAISDDDKPLIVKEKGEVLHKELNTTRLTLIDVTAAEGAEPIVCYEDAIDLDVYEVGDVVRVAIGADEYVEAIEVLADLGTVASDKIANADPVVAPTFSYGGNFWFRGTGITTDDVNADFRVVLGTVYAKETDTMQLTPGYTPSSSDLKSIAISDSVPVYRIDIDSATETQRINTSSMGEVVPYNVNSALASRVLVYTVEGITKAMIIFE